VTKYFCDRCKAQTHSGRTEHGSVLGSLTLVKAGEARRETPVSRCGEYVFPAEFEICGACVLALHEWMKGFASTTQTITFNETGYLTG
jgi:hypothetical protein